MYLHRLYIGCGGQSEEAIDELDSYAARLGDFTVYRAYGTWGSTREATLVYEHVSEASSTPFFIMLLAEHAKYALAQEAVMYVRCPVEMQML